MKKITSISKIASATATGLGLMVYSNWVSAAAAAYVAQVPEPSVISLLAGGVAATVIVARLRRKK